MGYALGFGFRGSVVRVEGLGIGVEGEDDLLISNDGQLVMFGMVERGGGG